MLCCLPSFALTLAAERLGRGPGENTAKFRAACAIATQAQDIVEEPTPRRGGFGEAVGKGRGNEEGGHRRSARRSGSDQGDGSEGRRNRREEKCHAFGSGDARSRHLDTSATLAHAVALAVQAAQE
ncbi:hypothetical protein ERJ75_001802800 [Trypanosoma vivax]|nr:hypothetical protein ERJ75_001802800 [Trypanosoma vivax]